MTRRTDDQRENLDQHLAGLSCFISLVAFAPSCGFVLLRAKHLFSQAWPYQAGGEVIFCMRRFGSRRTGSKFSI
jgi:hypothetical protein